MKLYPASNIAGWHTDTCNHLRPFIKTEKGKVHDPKWGIDCEKCAPALRKLGWTDDIEERPLTTDETRKAEAALKRANLTAAQSQGMIADILAHLIKNQK